MSLKAQSSARDESASAPSLTRHVSSSGQVCILLVPNKVMLNKVLIDVCFSIDRFHHVRCPSVWTSIRELIS